MSTATTPAHILHHTTTFISQTLSQPDLLRILFSSFRSHMPPPDSTSLRSLNLAVETLENALSTTSPSIQSSSLRCAENLLLRHSKSTFSSFLLSLIYTLCRRPVDAAHCLLDFFSSGPSLARLEIAPSLFEQLFLIHFLPVLEWYTRQRSTILSSLSLNSAGSNGDDQSVAVSQTRLLSNMSSDQASELKELERNYAEILDENCRVFAGYFKDVLENRDGNRLIHPPSLVLTKSNKNEISQSGKDKKIKADEYGLRNGRYNPIWIDEEKSVEFNSSKARSLSKFPSFFPERVSPHFLTNHKSPGESRTSPTRISDSELEYSSDDNSTNPSSLDAEPELEENNKTKALLNYSQKQHISAEPSRSTDPFMASVDNPSCAAKHTPPKDFVCPITSHIFDDPVTLETGQTYERKAIQEWIGRGNSSCPITRQELKSTQLPKTNYVLKHLIASWKEQNPSSVPIKSEEKHTESEPVFSAVVPSPSPNNVIRQASINGTVNELRLAIANLCMSETLKESEMVVLQIEQFWKLGNAETETQMMLSKPAVINGFVEVLFNSLDPVVLKAILVLLSELGSRDNSVIHTLTRVDSDVEGIIALFIKGLLEAVVLIYLLRPSTVILVEMDMVDALLDVVRTDENHMLEMCMNPKKAAVILLGQILRSDEGSNKSEISRKVISRNLIASIIGSLEAEWAEERSAAIGILLRCMEEDGKCRNIIADKAEMTPVLESFIGASDEERFEIVKFLSELVRLNRRTFNEQVLHIIKDEGSFSIMHILLIYLQEALQDQCPIVAGLLLQLDLLVEPRKMSIYREEAIDTLISCLRNTDFPAAQMAAAKTILALQGRFSSSGKPLVRILLLRRAGFDKNSKSLLRREQLYNISGEAQENLEEEKAAEDWERKVALVLVSHEFGLLLEALAEGIKSEYTELCSACFVSATWLVYMLNILPETGIRGAARICLLKHFLSIFRSSKDNEDKALSMLALNSFIHDTEGLHDLNKYMKDILKGLRELKKSSTMAFEMLKVLSEEHVSSTDFWNHQELVQADCSVNGEVLSIVCFSDEIFSGHSDGTIKVWTCKGSSLHLIQEAREHTKAVSSLVILKSGERLYSGSLDKTVRAWIIGKEAIHCEQVHDMKDQVNNLVVANSISCFIPQGAGIKIHSWNGASKLLNQNKYVKCLALVNGKLYCGCHDNSIQEIDLATATLTTIQSGSRKLLGKPNPIHALQVHDKMIYSASSSLDGANVKIWSASNYNLVGSLPSAQEVRTITISSELIYLGCKGGIVEVWCRNKLNRVETLQTGTNGRVLSMALDSNEDVFVVGTSDGKIQAWRLS